MWFAVAKFVAVIVASYLLNQAMARRNKTSSPAAATEDDFNFPQPDEGTPQCVFFGDCWTGDWCVMCYGNFRYEAIKK